jgi:hypothetical protein
MYGVVGAAEVMGDIMNLGMAVVAAGNAVVCTGLHNLVELYLAVGPPRFGKTGLKKAAAAAATEVVRLVRGHLDDVLFADYRSDDKTQIIGDDVAEAFPDNLAGVLDSELDFSLAVPLRADFQPSLADPFGVVGVD